ncbi:MAG: hypothetical protein DCC45_12955 [Armatimonadetes bacterium]|nr:MAG: hypothetical protein DCC45_12955 [Armatimonadota bacterium]
MGVYLGHKQDDESGLLYMRARYYEPWTGRFVTEDPALDGWNWFVYAGNEPVSKVDATGRLASVVTVVGYLLHFVSWASIGNSLVGTVPGFILIGGLGRDLANAGDSVDVEHAWSRFVEGWSWSPLTAIDPSGDLNMAANLVSYVVGLAGGSLGQVSNLLTAALAGCQLSILCIGYTMRIEWYLAKTDEA